MMDKYIVLVDPSATADLDEAVSWYEEKKHGLGLEFMMDFHSALNLLKSNPKLYQKVVGEFRRVIMRKYPYAIYYTIEGREVLVIAVWHSSRDHKRLEKRIKLD